MKDFFEKNAAGELKEKAGEADAGDIGGPLKAIFKPGKD